MERREPELILDQMKTMGALYAKELPAIIRNPKVKGIDYKSINTVYAIGDGDSLFAAQAAAYGFKEISGINYQPFPALEFYHYILPTLGRKDPARCLLIGISASGGSVIVIKAIEELRQKYPQVATIAVAGKDGSALAAGAQYSEPVQLAELGRSPGIRTYAASLAGLFTIACSIGEAKGRKSSLDRETIAGYLEAAAPGVEKTVEKANSLGAETAKLMEGQIISCAGTGPDQATAAFSGAKIVEGAGVFATGQDLEEWNHVESFAYPLETPMLVVANPGPALKRAASLIRTGKALGHKVVVVCPEELHDFDTEADMVLPVYGAHQGLLAPLVQYVPGTVLAYYIAKKTGRAMFMTDRA